MEVSDVVDQDSRDDWTTRGLPEHPYPLHRFTVDDLYRLAELQLIGEGVELIDGYIVHRGTGRIIAFFPTDYEEMVAHGVLRRADTVFVDGTIRDVPPAGGSIDDR
jgi:hypothetical protein